MADKNLSLGQAIDKLIEALEPLDPSTRQTAINAACTHLNVQFTGKETIDAKLRESSIDRIPISDAISTQKQVDIRTFKEEKIPKTAVQMACVVAFYLQELAPQNERKQTVNSEDLEKYFKQAKFQLPKVIKQLLPDARVAGYFDSAPGKGEYTLNAVGYNLVAHNLPQKPSKK